MINLIVFSQSIAKTIGKCNDFDRFDENNLSHAGHITIHHVICHEKLCRYTRK